MNEKEFATSRLQTGTMFRMIDGRWNDGFVDPAVLKELVDEGVAEVVKRQGMDFVQLATK